MIQKSDFLRVIFLGHVPFIVTALLVAIFGMFCELSFTILPLFAFSQAFATEIIFSKTSRETFTMNSTDLALGAVYLLSLLGSCIAYPYLLGRLGYRVPLANLPMKHIPFARFAPIMWLVDGNSIPCLMVYFESSTTLWLIYMFVACSYVVLCPLLIAQWMKR